MDCIFCKIIDKKVPSQMIYENDQLVAFKDINPAAKTHILVVPRKHIPTFKDIDTQAGDDRLLTNMFLAARNIASEKNLKGYKLNFNVDKAGGQEVFHLHLHLLSNA